MESELNQLRRTKRICQTSE